MLARNWESHANTKISEEIILAISVTSSSSCPAPRAPLTVISTSWITRWKLPSRFNASVLTWKQKKDQNITNSLARHWTTPELFAPETEKNCLWSTQDFRVTYHLLWLPILQIVPDRFKDCKQLLLSQGNIHMSNFMNLLKVLVESVLWISIFLLWQPREIQVAYSGRGRQKKGNIK